MDRHDRQMRVFGEDGQRRMAEAVVGIIGCGGLGTNVATALTVAGVGRLVLMDPDRPEITNLNRQYVYCDRLDESRPKAELLAEWVRSRDASVEVEAHATAFSRETQYLLDDCDILVDCLDTMAGRMELNRYSVESGKPLVHGGIDGFIGQLAVCIPGRTPCLHCMMGSVPERRGKPVSIGAVVSTVGSMEAAEVLKLITGREETAGSFLSMDLESWRFQRIAFERDPACPVCGSRPRSRVEVLAEVAVPSVGEHRDDIPRFDLLGQLPDGGHAGTEGEARGTSFQVRDQLLQGLPGGIPCPAVLVPSHPSEAVLLERRRLVNRHVDRSGPLVYRDAAVDHRCRHVLESCRTDPSAGRPMPAFPISDYSDMM